MGRMPQSQRRGSRSSTSRRREGLLPEDTFPADHPLPNWARLLANFPKAGPAKIATLRTAETKGNLPAKLKAQLAWVSARADRAWYALAHARDRLRALGQGDDAIFAIDQASEPNFTPGELAAFAFARKLTVDPALIGDADFNALKKYYSDSEIAELIYHVNHDVFFNRLTEAANLPLDGGPSIGDFESLLVRNADISAMRPRPEGPPCPPGGFSRSGQIGLVRSLFRLYDP